MKSFILSLCKVTKGKGCVLGSQSLKPSQPFAFLPQTHPSPFYVIPNPLSLLRAILMNFCEILANSEGVSYILSKNLPQTYNLPLSAMPTKQSEAAISTNLFLNPESTALVGYFLVLIQTLPSSVRKQLWDIAGAMLFMIFSPKPSTMAGSEYDFVSYHSFLFRCNIFCASSTRNISPQFMNTFTTFCLICNLEQVSSPVIILSALNSAIVALPSAVMTTIILSVVATSIAFWKWVRWQMALWKQQKSDWDDSIRMQSYPATHFCTWRFTGMRWGKEQVFLWFCLNR